MKKPASKNSASSRKRPVKKTPKVVKKRARKTVANDETCLHMHCWQWAQKEHPRLLIFHVANERKAKVQYHNKLKRMGVLPGVADFLAFPADGRRLAIEIKDDEGSQDDDQIRFEQRWRRAGGEYFLVRTLEEFQDAIEGPRFPWG